MINCPYCQARYLEGTLFCSECGTYLSEESKRETDLLLGEWLEEIEAPFLSQDGGPIAVRLSIGGHERQVVLPLSRAIHLGRLDPESQVFPDVDLTDDEGRGTGVSRRHARIFKRETEVVIEDLGSVNGTFVNGKRLARYAAAILAHGDRLQLGRLIIRIFFEDEEGISQKQHKIRPVGRKEYVEQRLGDLFEFRWRWIILNEQDHLRGRL